MIVATKLNCDIIWISNDDFVLRVIYRSEFHVVHPLSIELPPSLGIVVINWNIPMHLFLKDCELK
jgi:hypothetical protein